MESTGARESGSRVRLLVSTGAARGSKRREGMEVACGGQVFSVRYVFSEFLEGRVETFDLLLQPRAGFFGLSQVTFMGHQFELQRRVEGSRGSEVPDRPFQRVA